MAPTDADKNSLIKNVGHPCALQQALSIIHSTLVSPRSYTVAELQVKQLDSTMLVHVWEQFPVCTNTMLRFNPCSLRPLDSTTSETLSNWRM